MANDPKESKVAGKVGVAPAPGVQGVSDSFRGKWLDGTRHHRDQQAPGRGMEILVYMTSQPVQNTYAKLSLPIWASSYDDPAVTKGQEDLIAAAKVSLPLMFPRPTTPHYQELSSALQVGIQQAMLGTDSARRAPSSPPPTNPGCRPSLCRAALLWIPLRLLVSRCDPEIVLAAEPAGSLCWGH